MHTSFDTEIRELDFRSNDGIEVTLLWNSRTSRLYVSVVNERQGDAFRIEIEAADAPEAFNHPYAYASRRRRDDYAIAA
jgi:hypothetical protein